MQKKFYFLPLRAKQKLIEDEKFIPYAKIDSAGNLSMTRRTVEALGITWGTLMVSLFYDKDKRAIAWKFVDRTDDVKTVRVLKPYAINKNRTTEIVQFGISSFLHSLDKLVLPTPRLTIESYNDKDEYMSVGEVFYVIIPKQEEDKTKRFTQDAGRAAFEERVRTLQT